MRFFTDSLAAMDISARIAYFDSHYDIISSGHYGTGRKIFISSNTEKCRFCDNVKASTEKFSNDSHAIPQFLGNRQLILLDECDDCNTFFSNTLEDHLDKYTKPYRVFAAIRGAKKVPKYKSKDGKSRVVSESDTTIHLHSPRDGGIIATESNNSQKLQFDIEPHIPAAVYKALVKIGISLVRDERELPAFSATIQWLKDSNHSHSFIQPLQLLMTFIPGYRPQRSVAACLLRCKQVGTAPYAVLVLSFGNWVYQVYIPSHLEATKEQTLQYDTYWFPMPFEKNWPIGPVSRRIVDLTSDVKAPAVATMTIHFDKKVRIK